MLVDHLFRDQFLLLFSESLSRVRLLLSYQNIKLLDSPFKLPNPSSTQFTGFLSRENMKTVL